MPEDFDDSIAGAVARLLIEGPVGLRLFSALMEEFGTASRYDVFLGVSVAVAVMVADLAIAEAELAQTRRGAL